MHPLVEAGVTIALAIVGLGVVSVIVSKNANTAGVVQSGGSAFSNALGVAESPVTGNSVSIDTSYPSSSPDFSMSLAGAGT